MNTAIASAKNPILMASAMRKAVETGREAFLAGRIPRKETRLHPHRFVAVFLSHEPKHRH